MEAYAAAGYNPQDFWGLSPRLYVALMRAAQERFTTEHRSRAWTVWHIEALHRSKKLPEFQKFSGQRQTRRQSPEELNAMGQVLAKIWKAKPA